MYSKHESSMMRQEFWTVFGKYMSPIVSAEGEKINWVNYKTGQRHIRFVMEAGNKEATIAIVLSHPDDDERKEVFNKMKVIKDELEGEWEWQSSYSDEHGHIMSRIFISIENVSVLNKAHWPQLISFFKPRLMVLDRFWADNKFIFE